MEVHPSFCGIVHAVHGRPPGSRLTAASSGLPQVNPCDAFNSFQLSDYPLLRKSAIIQLTRCIEKLDQLKGFFQPHIDIVCGSLQF